MERPWKYEPKGQEFSRLFLMSSQDGWEPDFLFFPYNFVSKPKDRFRMCFRWLLSRSFPLTNSSSSSPSLAVSHILSIQCSPSGQLGQFVHYFSTFVIIFIVDNIANILNICVSFSIFFHNFPQSRNLWLRTWRPAKKKKSQNLMSFGIRPRILGTNKWGFSFHRNWITLSGKHHMSLFVEGSLCI